jgi:hypothetical protein
MQKKGKYQNLIFFSSRVFSVPAILNRGFAGPMNYHVATLPRLCYKPTSISFQVFDFSGNFAEFRVIEEY